METILNTLNEATHQRLGEGGKDFSFWQAVLQAVIVYVIALLTLRTGKSGF